MKPNPEKWKHLHVTHPCSPMLSSPALLSSHPHRIERIVCARTRGGGFGLSIHGFTRDASGAAATLRVGAGLPLPLCVAVPDCQWPSAAPGRWRWPGEARTRIAVVRGANKRALVATSRSVVKLFGLGRVASRQPTRAGGRNQPAGRGDFLFSS